MKNLKYDRKQWGVQFNGYFFEVLPVDDIKEHGLGDECECHPDVQRAITPNPFFRGTIFEPPKQFEQAVIVHHSFDKREVIPKSNELPDISEPAP